MALTKPSRPRPSRTLGEPMSALTVDLIRKGLSGGVAGDTARPALTDKQALVERLEDAAKAGRASNAMRRSLLLEAANFIRAQVRERAA